MKHYFLRKLFPPQCYFEISKEKYDEQYNILTEDEKKNFKYDKFKNIEVEGLILVFDLEEDKKVLNYIK